MFQIPTLYTNYQELLLDLDIYGSIVSRPILSRDELRDILFEEYKLTHPLPTLEDKRYELSRLVSSDYHISYANELDLASNEKLVDLGVDSDSISSFEFDDGNIIVPEIFKEKFEYGSITDRVREELIKSFISETENISKEDAEKAEEVFNTVSESDSVIYEEDYDYDDSSTAFENCSLDDYLNSIKEENEISEDSNTDDDSYDDNEDESDFGYEDDEAEPDDEDESDDSDLEDESDDEDFGDYDSDEDEDFGDYDSDDEENESDSDDEEEYDSDEDEDDFGDYDSDDEESDDDFGDYSDEDESEDEDDYSDEDESEDEDDSDYDDSDYGDSDEDEEDDSDYGDYDEDESDYDDSEDEEDEQDYDDSEDEEPDYSGDEPEDTVNLETVKVDDNEEFIPDDSDLSFEDISVPTPVEIANINKQKEEEAKPVIIPEAKVNREEEPKDLREFVRKHPRCEISFALKYFSRKEIEKYIMMGKVIKKGSKLHI